MVPAPHSCRRDMRKDGAVTALVSDLLEVAVSGQVICGQHLYLHVF